MNILLHAHSGLRYVVLALLVASVFIAYSHWKNGETGDSKVYLFGLISMHTQLLIGIILYTMSPKVDFSLMSEKVFRFFTVEHSLMMLIAVVLVTMGRSKSKKKSGAAKHKTVFYYYLTALLLVLLAIPWPFRGLGAGLF